MLDEELDDAVATYVRLTIGVSFTGSYFHKLKGKDGAIKDFTCQLQSKNSDPVKLIHFIKSSN